MVNRGAILIKYREPAIRWINETDPYDEQFEIGAKDLQQDRTVYLVSEDVVDGEEAVNRWLEANFEEVFEHELGGWYTDPSLWPSRRTLKMFRDWFDVEYHSVIIDMEGGQIVDDDL
ncbi:hypothetical protein CRI94_11855 [Longibacter salinarum]|uniref:Uncharacterized protein n=1 Tax=Longibacter salinarum TaxID=1850348 RepID=A0A2A8CVP0_9BACT|nr:hypothetical protein [Longibacter salinarum]PEN12716.1 hypothetical protein CRI94_11855 [Longibacter salinarum]